MSRDDTEYWKAKAESLERQAEQNRVVQHHIIAMAIGMTIYLVFDMSIASGIGGTAIAAAYLISVKSFF